MKSIFFKTTHSLVILLLFAYTPKLAAETCKERIAIAPPVVADPKYGTWLVTEAKKIFKQAHSSSKCPLLLDFDKTFAYFDYSGLSFYFSKDPKRLGARQISYIQSETMATKLMFISLKGESKLLIKVFSIQEQDGEVILDRPKRYIGNINLKAGQNQKSPIFRKYLALLAPNAVTLGISNTNVIMLLEDGYKEKETTNAGTLPPFISSISFSKITNSAAYNIFDIEGAIFPGTFFFAINQRTKIAKDAETDNTPPTEETLRVEAYGGCTNINALGTIFWPLGATYSSLGFGPCLFRIKGEDKESSYNIDLATRLLMGHRVFLARPYYLYLEFDFLFFTSPLYHSELAKSDSIFRSSIGLGWYIADAERSFLNLIDWVF